MAMTNAGFDGTVNEAQYATMWALGGQDAVESTAAWAVTPGTGRQVSVAAQNGWAFAKGVISKETVALTQNLGTPTNGQFYLIARHIDWTSNAVTIVGLAGPTTSTTTPTVGPADFSGVAGRSTTPGVVFDQPLAWAWVNSVNTTVTIFDLRTLPLVVNQDSGWQTPTLGASWASVAGLTLQYRKFNGVVYFQGRITGGTTATAFTLPVGFRPNYDAYYNVQNGTGVGSATRIVINSATGAVTPITATTPNFEDIPPYLAAP